MDILISVILTANATAAFMTYLFALIMKKYKKDEK